MLTKTDIKYWARSGSWRFMRDHRRTADATAKDSLKWNGRRVHYRAGTSDTEIIYKILLKTGKRAEYRIPDKLQPKVILDIGANIGASSLFLARRFPDAQIYAFEPVPANFRLLERNVSSYPTVRAYPVALGAENGTLSLFASDSGCNFGGFSFFRPGSNAGKTVDVDVRRPDEMLKELGIDHVDLIKIDTEGSEYTILTAFDNQILSTTSWITGELHGERDFELLAYLSNWFDVEMKKALRKRLFIFNACNRAAAL